MLLLIANLLSRHKSKIFIFGFFIFLLFILYYASNQSRISIVYSGDPVEINLLNQDSNSTKRLIISQNTTVRVKAGSYELAASTPLSSYFEVLSTNGFFRKSTTNVTLKPALKPDIIGNNPGTCTIFNSIAYSYDCNSDIKTLKAHNPSSSSSPPITSRVLKESSTDIVAGHAQVSEEVYFLIQKKSDYGYVKISRLDEKSTSPELITVLDLPDLNPSLSYRITSYQDGLLIYNDQLSVFTYISDIKGMFKINELDSFKNIDSETFTVSDISTEGNRIVITLNNAQDSTRKINKSRIITGSEYGDDIKQYDLDSIQSDSSFCGTDQICSLGDGTVTVFDLINNAEKLKKNYKVINTDSFIVDEEGALWIGRENDLIFVNTGSRKGFVAASYRNLSFDSLSTNQQNILLVASSSNVKNIFLFAKDSLGINIIVDALPKFEENPYIEAVSVYKNLVYITPDVGDPIYLVDQNIFGFSPEKRRQAADEINRLSEQTGLSQNGFTVINLLP